jgi:hypothetical protein
VHVALPSGNMITIPYSADWTVRELKEAIATRTGNRMHRECVVVAAGKPLTDRMLISQTKIRHRSLVVLLKLALD